MTPNNGSSPNCPKSLEGNVSHSTSMPCLIKSNSADEEEAIPAHVMQQLQELQQMERRSPEQADPWTARNNSPPIQQRSMSLTALQPKV